MFTLRALSAAFTCASISVTAIAAAQSQQPASASSWPAYGGDGAGTRYSAASQIDASNVAKLVPAWTYRTGEISIKTAATAKFEATPIVVGGIMYIGTPLGKAIALDPVDGKQRWVYDAKVDPSIQFGDFASRGVSTWLDAHAKRGAACARTIFMASADARLIALDALTGTLCTSFGKGGSVDLKAGLRNPPHEPGAYAETSPPAVIGDVVVVGSSIGDNGSVDRPSGEVRAYNARTGALEWSFDPIPQDPNDPVWKTWHGPRVRTTGAGNVWSMISVDPARGLVFLPTTSPSPDFFGGSRLGDNRYASSIVALHARTGKIAWSFQTVHHDLWDYDNAAPPALVTIRKDGRNRDVVLEATKTGQLFVLDRDTGKPVYPVEERPVPATDIPGDSASPTQPFNTVIAPTIPVGVSSDEIWGPDSSSLAECRTRFAGLRNSGIYTPPSLEGTVMRPSNVGGSAWGGVAFDPLLNTVFFPVNRIASVVQLVDSAAARAAPVSNPQDRLAFQQTKMHGTPYVMRRWFLATTKMIPCTKPPFGSMLAINLGTGAKTWEVPNGSWPAGAKGNDWGSLSLGGPIVTRGGLVFQAGTLDRTIRAYDVRNGKELWRTALSAGARATPMTYVGRDGRQYVVIAAGGGDEFGPGDYLIAFALPHN